MVRFLLIIIASALLGLAAGAEVLAANLVARIDVGAQTMTVSRDGRVIHRWPVSTARKGFVTPRGSYRPTRMHRMWHSRKYDMSPMPFSIFFRGGYAIHGTNEVRRLGRPASHGCVRLHTANARKLYRLVEQSGRRNTRIVVVN
jgi:lipoprotein-anchoring transpeptidase ErfK/SrfK